MRISSAYPSKYLKSSDIPEGRQARVTISNVDAENVAGNDNPDEIKPVLYFEGKDKGMVLNKTNAGVISAAYGDETDEWVGKNILIYASETTFQGKVVPCLRVKIDRGPARPTVVGNGARKVAEPAPTSTAKPDRSTFPAEDEVTDAVDLENCPF